MENAINQWHWMMHELIEIIVDVWKSQQIVSIIENVVHHIFIEIIFE